MRICCALVVAGLAACNGSTKGGGPVGYGGPTVAVTIDGNHLGSTAPDPGSSATLADTKDSLGRVIDSQFRVTAGSTPEGASCQLAFERYGDDVTPIVATGYMVAAGSGTGGTPSGTVAPIVGERVVGPGDSYSCAGSSCDGAGLVITVLDAAHVEGYFTGTLASDHGGPPAEVVCSFYVPMESYVP